MRKNIVFLFVLCISSLTFSQLKSTQDAAAVITQPYASIRGDSIHFTANQYAPLHKSKVVKVCKGAVLLPSGTSGYLAVHLTLDPVGKWYKIYLNNDGVPVGAEFDMVGDSTKGTTVARDTSLYIFPYLYKNP